jgi:uncharacterized SAM-binding protein YcdF (DUF218 family)
MTARGRWLGLAAIGALLALIVRSIAVVGTIPASLRASDAWRGDAVFVPNGDPDDSRTRRASELLLSGRARYLVIAGSGFGGDSAEYLAVRARAAGVPSEALLLERRSTSTWDNFAFSRELLESHGIHRMLVVTNLAHARRAVLSARAALPGIEIAVEAVDEGAPIPLGIRTKESLKTAHQILALHLPVWATVWP